MDKHRKSSALLLIAGIIVLLVMGAFLSLTIQRGELNQDEGWYLYGAGLINAGQKPYIDFATTQGPVMQYVYAAFWFMVAKWGVLGGRVLTGLLGVISIVLSAAIAWRLLRPSKRMLGALIVLSLAGLNVYQLYFFSIVKTYALAAVWISASFFLLTFSSKLKHTCAFAAGIMIMLAVGTRMSAGACMPAILLGLLLEAKRTGSLKSDLRWLAYGVGAAICLAVTFAPFVLKAPEAVKFAMFDYHAGRQGCSLAYKGGFISRLVRAYYPAILILLGVGAYGILGRAKADAVGQSREGRFALMLLGGVLLVTILHLAAPFPYDDYQVMLFPVFCAGLVVAGSGLLPEEGQVKIATFVVIAGLLFAGASPVNEKMFIGKRDRIWWPMRTETSLQKLGRAADFITERTGQSRQILTQDMYIAVETGLRVPAGMELGPFCFFPEWPRAKAEKLHVVNEEMLREILSSSDANVAAVSEYGFAISAPDILPYGGRDELLTLLDQNFAPVEKISDFGQAETELTIFSRKR